MCGELVSCAEFRAILTLFSEVIRYSSFRKDGVTVSG